MTIGNRSINTQVPPYDIGYSYYRSWSGEDYPVALPESKINKSAVRQTGRGSVSAGPLRTSFPRPPKRAFTVEHPYSMSLTERANNRIYDSFPTYIGYSPTYLWGGAANGPLDSDWWGPNDDLALLGKLRERVAGSDFNAGVFLGTGHQTLRLIGDRALSIGRALRLVRRGRFHDAAAVLTGNHPRPRKSRRLSSIAKDDVSGAWLELQYGWLPLLNDVYDGAQFLAHHLNTPLQVTVRTSRSHKKVFVNRDFTSGYPDTAESITAGHIKAILREKDVAQLAGLQDPASLAWELLPWSFVVDWFIPIGSYLEARGLQSALTGTFVTTRVFKAQTGGYQARKHKVSGYFYRRVFLNRTVSTTLSVPTPSFKPLGKVASWQHAANSIALLLQVSK